MQRHLKALGAALALATIACGAAAQAVCPGKPIRIVVGYPAGQTVDIIARNYAALLGKELGTTAYVDNKPGANGIPGAQEVKRAAPDGCTLLFGTSGQIAINPALYKNLPYDPAKDFAPVSLVTVGPLYLIANPAFPPNSVPELIAYAKARPGKVDYGSGGIGITAHLAMELLESHAGIKLNHVPYKGSPGALNDLIGGRISLMFEAGSSALPHVQAGRLKAIAVTGHKRNEQLPNVPTVEEQGLKGFDVTSWAAVLAPAGTPEPVLAAIAAAIRRASATPAIVESVRSTGAETVASTPQQFAAFLQGELKKFAKAVADGNVQVE